MALLEIRDLVKTFGGLTAIDQLEMQVEEGEIISVIGPNGAGKTTLFNLITGMDRPDGGSIRFDGTELVGLNPAQILKLGIARTFQTVRLFPEMTIRENIMVARHARTRSGIIGAVLRTKAFRTEEGDTTQRAETAASFFGTRLAGYRLEQRASALSYANRRRLEMARAMASGPRLLLLDEPVAGMNPRESVEVTEKIRQMRDQLGFTILFIEHDMRVVKGVSERVIVIDYGRKIAEGPYDNVAHDPQVIEAYLGRPVEAGA